MLREDLAKDIVEIQRMSSRVMSINMMLDRKVCHVVSSYAPQGGRSEEEKAEFWGIQDDSIGRISEKDLLIIGGDLNGHGNRLPGEACLAQHRLVCNDLRTERMKNN